MFRVANQNQQSISCQSIMLWKSVQLQWHVQKDTEKQARSEVLFPACRPYIALIDMGKIIRHKMAPLTSGLIMSMRYHLSSFVTMLLISSVLMTPNDMAPACNQPKILPFYHNAFMEAFYLNFMLFSLFQLQYWLH